MSVLWSKVWFDLWHNKIRTILVVLSISAGVFAVGTMFGMVDQLLSGMDASHRAVNPSHLIMWFTQRIDRNLADSLRKIPGVEGVEAYNQLTARYKLHPQDDWKTGLIAMRDDFENQRYDVTQLRGGQWPAGNDIGVERLTSQYYGLDIGDQVIFEIGGKREKALTITGKVRHPFVPPPQFGGEAVFFFSGQALELLNVPEGEFGSLFVRVKPYSAALARQVATDLKERLAKEGVGVAGTLYQDPDKHWGRVFVEGISLVLQLLAIISSLMSVVLVYNTLTSLITQQTHQIGIIKAIGGRSSTILKLYLTGVVIYGLLALLISLPLGAFLAFGLSRWFLNLFNIDYDTFQLSNQAVVLQVLAALAVPVLAAFWPVLKGAGVTVREAIASYGLGADFGSSWLDQAIERLGRALLSAPYAMALGNLFRRKGRLAYTQLVLVTAGCMFLLVMSLSSSLLQTLDTDLARRNYDLTLLFGEFQRADRTQAIAYNLGDVEKVELWFSHPASVLRGGKRAKEAGLGTDLVGLPADSDMYRPAVVAGRWLQPGDGRVIVMNQKTAEDNGIALGDTISVDLAELGRHEWQVVGMYRVVFSDAFNADPLYAPQPAVFEATKKYHQGGQLQVRLRTRTAEAASQAASQLKDLFKARNMKVVYSQTLYDLRQMAAQQFDTTLSMLLALAVIVAVVGGIGLMGSLSISVVERTREIGVMRAIGARSRTLLGMFLMEGVLQGALSWLIALPLSFLAGQPVAALLGRVMFNMSLAYEYNWQAVGVWLLVILVISSLASLLPARNAARVSVRDSLAYA